MTVKSYIKEHGWGVDWNGYMDGICRSFNSVDINIGFINSDGEEDEVQFTINTYVSQKNSLEELDALFTGFCEENGYPRNTVTYVEPVYCYPCRASSIHNIPEEFLQCYTVEALYNVHDGTNLYFDSLRRVRARLGKSGESQMC